jgi:hypothetical protein
VLDQLGPGGDGLPHEIVRLLITLRFRLLATACRTRSSGS